MPSSCAFSSCQPTRITTPAATVPGGRLQAWHQPRIGRDDSLQLKCRQRSNRLACSSGRSGEPEAASARPVGQGQPFGTPVFNPAKLTVQFLPATTPTSPVPPNPRRYTLTHNDLTGELLLAIGQQYNSAQLSGWYVRMVRDEVLAEWSFGPDPSLQIYCHVSGQQRWLAPPALRDYIFRREMPLVLDLINYAEQELLAANPQLATAPVVVHLSSHVQELNLTVVWGNLSQRHTWLCAPESLLQRWWQSMSGSRNLVAGSNGVSAGKVQLVSAQPAPTVSSNGQHPMDADAAALVVSASSRPAEGTVCAVDTVASASLAHVPLAAVNGRDATCVVSQTGHRPRLDVRDECSLPQEPAECSSDPDGSHVQCAADQQHWASRGQATHTCNGMQASGSNDSNTDAVSGTTGRPNPALAGSAASMQRDCSSFSFEAREYVRLAPHTRDIVAAWLEEGYAVVSLPAYPENWPQHRRDYKRALHRASVK